MTAADLLIVNAKVVTVDEKFSIREAIAVKNGWIIDVGSDEELRRYVGPDTEVMDLAGKMVLPAAHDSHLHAALTGLKMGPQALDLTGPEICSLEALQEALRGAIALAPPGAWIYGLGFSAGQIKECAKRGYGLTKEDLDSVSPRNPVMLHDYSLHTLVVNSRALALAGIDKDLPPLAPEEGEIRRDPVSGEPTGALAEWGAQNLVGRQGPLLTEEQIEDCILRVQRALNSYGITAHTDIVGPAGDYLYLGAAGSRVLEAYDRLQREGRLTCRVSCHLFVPEDGIHRLDKIIAGLEKLDLPDFLDRNWVKAETVKLFCDRGFWARNGSGRSMFAGESATEQQEELQEAVLELHRRGWQLAIHALGGQAIDAVVAAYGVAGQEFPGPNKRHIVLHADDMTPENAEMMARHGMICSPQPIAGSVVADFMAKQVTAGEELFNWQHYLARGVVVAAGSDAPCFSLNWLEGLQFAVARTTAGGQQVRPDLAMSLPAALWMYTMGGALQEHMEEVRGSIEVGKVADFQVLDSDIFAIPPDTLGQVKVLMTICNGKVVYRA